MVGFSRQFQLFSILCANRINESVFVGTSGRATENMSYIVCVNIHQAARL